MFCVRLGAPVLCVTVWLTVFCTLVAIVPVCEPLAAVRALLTWPAVARAPPPCPGWLCSVASTDCRKFAGGGDGDVGGAPPPSVWVYSPALSVTVAPPERTSPSP